MICRPGCSAVANRSAPLAPGSPAFWAWSIRACAALLADLRHRLIDGRLVIPFVDANEHVPRLNQLIARHGYIDNAPLTCELTGTVRIDEHVIGRLILARIEPPQHPAGGMSIPSHQEAYRKGLPKDGKSRLARFK